MHTTHIKSPIVWVLSKTAWLGCILLSLGLGPQALAASQDDEVIEEVVVTGSFIRGTPEDAALPVDVFDRGDFSAIGNPTITELIRNLGVANGNLGETNQFNASGGQGNEGVATVNLRGLGSARTLVLLNGRRHVSVSTFGVDISAVPSIATQRIEVLKDGAAALYGSDAIAGVVNFITRDDFEGTEFQASGQFLDGSDGEATIAGIHGWSNDRWNVVGSVEWDTRSKLQASERDWAIRPLSENPQGGYSSIGNPGRIFPVSPSAISAANPFGFVPSADPECETLGGTVDGSTCYFQFTQFDNLTEEQDTLKLFGQASYALSDNIEWEIEALYANLEMPDWNTSPSYPPQSLFGPDRLIPLDHPGVIDFRNQYPDTIPDDTVALYTITRMTGWGGFLGQPENGTRETDTYRIATGLNGDLFSGELGFDIALSWSKRERRNTGPDMFVERMAFALDGLGGPDCDVATGTPGEGPCMYYTPFSNGVAASAFGHTNPRANPDLVRMNETLFPWLVTDLGTTSEFELFVFDATFNGELDSELGAGNIGWAAGIQSRNEKYDLNPDAINDLSVNPCPFIDPMSVTLGHTTSLDCTGSETGRFAFLSGTNPAQTERTVYGAFMELALPFSDQLDAQFALRFEDYGGDVGSTVDPKFALRFQATDALAFRGSVSTTFRGPPQPFLEGKGTSLQFVAPTNAFKAVDTLGNPNLDPEKATTFNIGAIYDQDGFYGSLDYWRFDFEDPFQVESFNAIVGAYSSNDCATGGTGVGSEICNQLESQIIFQEGQQGRLAGINRLEVNWINGTDITTSGIDWLAQYDFEVKNGLLTLGTQGTYTLEYDVDDFLNVDGIFLAPGGDFAGNLNDNRNSLTPVVDLQGNIFARYSAGPHSASLTGRYWGEYDDPDAVAALQSIDSMFTVDFTYNIDLMDEKLNLNLSVFNLLDEDPPQTQTDLNYDPYTHSAFGRVIKLGVRYTLDQG